MKQTAPAVEFTHGPLSQTKGESSQAGSSSMMLCRSLSEVISCHICHTCHGGLTAEDEWSGDGAARRESPRWGSYGWKVEKTVCLIL